MPDLVYRKRYSRAGYSIPAVHQTLNHLLQLSNQGDVEVTSLAAAVELDPGLLVAFLSRAKISELGQWASDLEPSHLRHEALTVANYWLTRDQSVVEEQFFRERWLKSYLRGAIAGRLALEKQLDVTRFRLLGLLAGLGHHLIALEHGEAYINELQNLDGAALAEAEMSLFGVRGDTLGAEFLGSLGLAQSDVDAILYQYAPTAELGDADVALSIVNLSNHLVMEQVDALSDSMADASREFLDIGRKKLTRALDAARDSMDSMLRCIATGPESKPRFFKNVALANVRCSLEQAIHRGSQPLELARVALGINDALDLEVKGQALQLGDGSGVKINLNSETSLVAEAVRSQSVRLLMEKDLASIGDRQLFQRLASKMMTVIPVAENKAAVFGHEEPIPPALVASWQEAVAEETASAVPGLPLEYVRQRVSEVTHEVNNPLAIVQNYLRTLAMKLDQESPVQDDIETISKELLRISGIIQKYREIGQQEDLFVGKANVNTLVSELVSVFQGGQDKITFTQRLDPAVPELLLPVDSFKQVLVNLLKNACEALEGVDQPEILVSTHASINLGGAHYVELTVADNGPGIPLEIQDRLFKPNNSSKGQGHSGLGLNIVKQLMDDMNGLVGCRTQLPGDGSTGTQFQLLIPVNNNS